METTNKLQSLTNAIREAANNFKTTNTGDWGVVTISSDSCTILPDGTRVNTMALHYTQHFLEYLNSLNQQDRTELEERVSDDFLDILISNIQYWMHGYEKSNRNWGYEFSNPNNMNTVNLHQADWGWFLVTVTGD